MWRLQALLRRVPKQPRFPVYTIGPWRFDSAGQDLVQGESRVRLTDTELTLLKTLLANPNAVTDRETLAAGCGVDAGERTIDVQVTRLRAKLEEDRSQPLYLQTVRGKGYLLRAQEAK